MAKPEIYISTDIEADGPIPGVYSMLSFASAAYLADKTLVDTFAINLIELPLGRFKKREFITYNVCYFVRFNWERVF